jgi:hypothetical protein
LIQVEKLSHTFTGSVMNLCQKVCQSSEPVSLHREDHAWVIKILDEVGKAAQAFSNFITEKELVSKLNRRLKEFKYAAKARGSLSSDLSGVPVKVRSKMGTSVSWEDALDAMEDAMINSGPGNRNGLLYEELQGLADSIRCHGAGRAVDFLPDRYCNSGRSAMNRAVTCVLKRLPVIACTYKRTRTIVFVDAHNAQVCATLYSFFLVSDDLKKPLNNAANNVVAAAVTHAIDLVAEAGAGDEDVMTAAVDGNGDDVMAAAAGCADDDVMVVESGDRSARFHPSTAMSHANDLFALLSKNNTDKNFVVCIVDGGSDWSVKSLLTFYYMGKLWKDKRLDGLVLTSYCASLSAFKPIEHFWSHLSRQLSALTLSAIAPGDTEPVAKLHWDGAPSVLRILFHPMRRKCDTAVPCTL